MKIRELLAHIDSFAPFALAEEWDNSGIITGSLDAEVEKIAVCLDAVRPAVIEAQRAGCNVLVCHHPLIFRPVKRITHTNWDKAPGGVNDSLAALLGLRETEPLDDFGVLGILNRSVSRDEFLAHVKASLGLTHIDFYGYAERIERVALCGGSGAEFWRAAKNLGADIYLTADMKYHELADAVSEGLAIGLIDHGEMERASVPELAKKISSCGIETRILDIKALPSPLRI